MASGKHHQEEASLSTELDHLHRATLDVVGAMNGPQRDLAILGEAGVTLEQALFPLLVLIDRIGPVGTVALADRVGRDYTTVSRQLDRLVGLGLIDRRAGTADRRVREAVIAPAGKAMNDAIDAARERLMRDTFAEWSHQDIHNLSVLMRRFAAMLAG
jgi:DNA-binding MarR family transcriptional regulator